MVNLLFYLLIFKEFKFRKFINRCIRFIQSKRLSMLNIKVIIFYHRIKSEGDNWLLKVLWKKRKNGITPKQTWLTNSEIKKHDPLLLVDFYESKIKKI